MSVADLRARRVASRPVLVVAVLAAWGSILAINASPAAFYFSHSWEPTTVLGQATAVVAYVAGWVLMSIAMMLPTTTHLLQDFAAIVRRRPERWRLELTVAAGFLTAWVVTGYLFRMGDISVHATVDAWSWLAHHTQVIEGGTLIVAGLFQFSSLKRRCLVVCRTPRSLIVRHWSGRRASVDAYHVGLAYGASCVGCCWALMLVMFGVGMSSPWLMLGLTAVMVAEKNLSRGPQLAQAMGAMLVLAGAATTLL